MALPNSAQRKAKSEGNTGFGVNSSYNAGRFVKKDGTINVQKQGIPVHQRISVYHTLLAVPRWKFIVFILISFISINILFASVYYLIGIDELGGINQGSALHNFGEAFFFSTQTFTTVGYGRISPSGFLTSAIAAIEALTGLLTFAVVTGLFYGRFSRPRAYLAFSDNAVIAPYKDITALMLRMAPYKNNQLTEVSVKVTVAMKENENGSTVNKFYTLDLEFSTINALALSWTVVHPIDDKSPFYNYTFNDILNAKAEFYVNVKGFDEAFSNTVVARTSYLASEIIPGAKFSMMYEAAKDGQSTILHIDRLNSTQQAPLPVAPPAAAVLTPSS